MTELEFRDAGLQLADFHFATLVPAVERLGAQLAELLLRLFATPGFLGRMISPRLKAHLKLQLPLLPRGRKLC